MMKKVCLCNLLVFALASCATYSEEEKGVDMFHWERSNTGVYKFARDHNECMKFAENWHLFPTVREIKSWISTEEAQYHINVDWHAERGIWASYVPYPGSMPLMVNTADDDKDCDPNKYRICMENKGYWHRTYDIPETTNLFVYRPQQPNQNDPLKSLYYRGGLRPTDQ